jgi:hypothetical protein
MKIVMSTIGPVDINSCIIEFFKCFINQEVIIVISVAILKIVNPGISGVVLE